MENLLIISEKRYKINYNSILNIYNYDIKRIDDEHDFKNYDLLIVDISDHKKLSELINLAREKNEGIPILILSDYLNLFNHSILTKIDGIGMVKIFSITTGCEYKLLQKINSMLNPEYPSLIEEIAFILPVYNEEKRFKHVINFSKKLIKLIEMNLFNGKIYFINDGSSDGTVDLTKKLMEEIRKETNYIDDYGYIFIHDLKNNTKKAGTYIDGIRNISADLLILVDADDSFNPSDISRMINIINEGYYDIIIGTKDMTGENRPLVRKVLSFFKRLLTKGFLPKGVNDSQTGLKIIKAEAARYIFPYLDEKMEFAIDLEMMYLAKRFNFRVLQLPVKCIDREDSHVDIIRDSIHYLKSILKISLKNYSLDIEGRE